jgi:basic amino acid/polyamine antiporter, APA family
MVANMIGTGVFTSLGYQVIDIKSGIAVILLWVVGGIIAFLGSMCYSMLGIAMPRSGGEYNYLSKIYHPSIGFLAGWVSALIGFAAPVAAAAVAFGAYLSNLNISLGAPLHLYPNRTVSAIIIVILLTLTNIFNKKVGARFQNVFTSLKIIFIVFLIGIGLHHGITSGITYHFDKLAFDSIISPVFVISMFFITYSYSGWNAICYISGGLTGPKRIFQEP